MVYKPSVSISGHRGYKRLYNLRSLEDTIILSKLLGSKIVMTLAQRTFLAHDLTFDIPSNTTFVSVTAQKMDESSDKLTVQILKDGQVVAEKSTTAPYGVADVSTTL